MKINLEYMIWVSFSLNPSFPPRSRLYEPEVTISAIPLFQSHDQEALDRLWAKWTNLGFKTRFAYFFSRLTRNPRLHTFTLKSIIWVLKSEYRMSKEAFYRSLLIKKTAHSASILRYSAVRCSTRNLEPLAQTWIRFECLYSNDHNG